MILFGDFHRQKKKINLTTRSRTQFSKAFLSVEFCHTRCDCTRLSPRATSVMVRCRRYTEPGRNIMARHHSVAKAFMLYRQKHLEDREVRDKLRFLMDYCDASNPATGSKYDANANVENKNIATLQAHFPQIELHPSEPPFAD